MAAGAGVSIDRETNYLARIMAISVVPFVPFVIAGFPNVIKITHHGQRPAVLLAVIASFLLVVAYCWYQVTKSTPEIRLIKNHSFSLLKI